MIGLYLKDHLGTDKVRISENPSTLVIVFCIDDERGRLQHRLEARQEVIADHDAEEFKNVLDAQQVIERMRAAGTESVGSRGESSVCSKAIALRASGCEARIKRPVDADREPQENPWRVETERAGMPS